ncbi:hypothetical protein OKW39_008882 [Paraburkholderia sp. MM6662-R1]
MIGKDFRTVDRPRAQARAQRCHSHSLRHVYVGPVRLHRPCPQSRLADHLIAGECRVSLPEWQARQLPEGTDSLYAVWQAGNRSSMFSRLVFTMLRLPNSVRQSCLQSFAGVIEITGRDESRLNCIWVAMFPSEIARRILPHLLTRSSTMFSARSTKAIQKRSLTCFFADKVSAQNVDGHNSHIAQLSQIRIARLFIRSPDLYRGAYDLCVAAGDDATAGSARETRLFLDGCFRRFRSTS